MHNAASESYYLETLKPLVDEFPESLLQGNNDGSLPLHLAVTRYKTSKEHVQFLLDACPEAAARADGLGQLPLHLAFHCREASDIVKRLVKVYPEALTVYNTRGYSPFHVACGSNPYEATLRPLMMLVPTLPSTRDSVVIPKFASGNGVMHRI